MTENQETQMMTMLTRCVNGIQRLEEGQTKLEVGQAKLEEGQAKLEAGQTRLEQRMDNLEAGQTRLEKEIQVTNKALAILADDSVRTRARVGILEQHIELTN